MSTSPREDDGDIELAAPAEPLGARHSRDAAAAVAVPTDLDDDEVVRTSSRSVPSTLAMLVGAILVATIANVVLAWLVLGATTQLRDQYTIANGLQRCLIRAQVNENTATDTNGTGYRAAVSACLTR